MNCTPVTRAPDACDCSDDGKCSVGSRCVDNCTCQECPLANSTKVVNPPLTFVVDTTGSVEPDHNSIMNLTQAVVARIKVRISKLYFHKDYISV